MNIKIQGIPFDVTAPYTEGHKVTVNEASALNQVRAENVANNVRKEIKEAVMAQFGKDVTTVPENETIAEETAEKLAATLKTYDTEYHFGMAGTRTTDPVQSMAKQIARTYIEKKCKSEGKTVKSYREAVGDEAYNALVAKIMADKKVQVQAKLIVDKAKKDEPEFTL